MSLFQANWSFSKLALYETCAFRFKLQHIDKVPEPPRDPDNPLDRGNRIHNNLEDYVKAKPGVSLETNEARRLAPFRPAIEHLRTLYAEGTATAEDNWFFDDAWDVCKRDKVWLWSKLDFFVHDEPENHGIVGDYKSGKSLYKALEHTQQMQLYAAAAAIRHPELAKITVELWYVDEGHVNSKQYTHEEAMRFIGRFDHRVQRIYSDRFFKPNPNKITCAYCPYGPKRGNGMCPVGV